MLIEKEKAIDTIHYMRKCCDTNDIDDFYNLLIGAFSTLTPANTDMSEQSERLWHNAYSRGWQDALDDLVSRRKVLDSISGDVPPEPRYPSWYEEKVRNISSVCSQKSTGCQMG